MGSILSVKHVVNTQRRQSESTSDECPERSITSGRQINHDLCCSVDHISIDDHQEAAKEASLLITATDYCWDLPASSVLVWPGISLVNTRNASFSAQMGSHAKICL